MSLARVKTWNPGDVLTAADLNAEFNNILNNSGTLISPLTANLNVNNFQMVNMRLENVATTQTPAQGGRIMFNSSAGSIDIDDGVSIRHVPGIKTSQVSSTQSVTPPEGMIAKAWVVFNGAVSSSQITAMAAFNVSTSANAIIRNSVGNYTIPWLTPFNGTNSYAITGSLIGSTAAALFVPNALSCQNAGVISFGSTTGSFIDASYVSVVAYGVQV